MGTDYDGTEELPSLIENLAYGAAAPEDGKAIIIRFSGPILRGVQGGLFGPGVDPVEQALTEIRAATVDPEVDAILFELNTPGGGVTASDELFHALDRFKQSRPDRKIVVLMKDLCASGGYYAAMAADHLVAQPTAVVGSVGVLINAVNFNRLATTLGIEDVTVASSTNKNIYSPLRPVKAEHKQILQGVVDEMYDRFRELVLANRTFDDAYADEHGLLDGRVFTMPTALEHGLVDEQGYAEDARAALVGLVGSSLTFYTYSQPAGLLGVLTGAEGPIETPQIELPGARGPEFLYLWQP